MNHSSEYKNIYTSLPDYLAKKGNLVIATVVESKGSKPQKPGISAFFGSKGLITGTIGGGATELAVDKEARNAIKTKKSGYLKFDLNNEVSDAESPICGGNMSILIDAEPLKQLKVFSSLAESIKKRESGILLTTFSFLGNKVGSIDRNWITTENSVTFKGVMEHGVLETALQILYMQGTEPVLTKNASGKLCFYEKLLPQPCLIIAGAGHIGKALSHLGKLLDFEVTVWDDRPEYANHKNLPDADSVLIGKIGECLGKIVVDSDTFIVIVTRGHKDDAEVLRKFIRSEAGYIGMIGSKRKVAQVKEMFLKNGWANPEQWDCIHTPVGIEIGSVTVQEIAISIAAQLIQVRNKNKR